MQVTLKDIAEKMGVTVTTIHKALNDKPGVSEKKRAEIMKVAAEMGYRVNYMASSLARNGFRIAVALPDPSGDNRYYYGVLWEGIREFLQTVTEFSFEISEFFYPFTPEGNGLMLEQIYNTCADRLDGLITIAMENDRTSYFIEKFAAKHIPIVMIGADLYSSSRLCCIKANDEMAGSLAAELMTMFLPDNRPLKIILTGDIGPLGMRDQHYNALAFRQYLADNAPFCEVLSFSNASPHAAAEDISDYLMSHNDVFSIYSCSARGTVYITDMLRRIRPFPPIRLVGNDLFPENAQALSEGAMHALVDKKIARQSFLAARTMFDYLIKKEYPHSSILSIEPEIVLRSNITLK